MVDNDFNFEAADLVQLPEPEGVGVPWSNMSFILYFEGGAVYGIDEEFGYFLTIRTCTGPIESEKALVEFLRPINLILNVAYKQGYKDGSNERARLIRAAMAHEE